MLTKRINLIYKEIAKYQINVQNLFVHRTFCKSILILSVAEYGARSIPLGPDLGLSFLVGDFVGDRRLLRLRDLLGFSCRLIDSSPYSARFLDAAKLLK